MSRYLLIGDCHLAATPPSARTTSYPEDILAKIRWCAEYANAHQLDAVIQLGDVFHHKQPSRTPHSLVVQVADVFQIFHGDTWIVPGNHDVVQDRMDSIPEQPLGALALAPRIHLLDRYVPDLGVLGIPYLDDFDEFHMRAQALTDPDLVGDSQPQLVVAHASVFPPGDHPPYPHIGADEVFTHGVPFAYGHIHIPHSYPDPINGTWFCNNGAISRGSLHEETVNRELKVTVFDSEAEGNPFTAVPIPYRPAAEVFRLAEVAEAEESEQRLDDFLDRVGEVSLTSLSLESVLHHAESTGELSEPAMAELRDIFEEVQ